LELYTSYLVFGQVL